MRVLVLLAPARAAAALVEGTCELSAGGAAAAALHQGTGLLQATVGRGRLGDADATVDELIANATAISGNLRRATGELPVGSSTRELLAGLRICGNCSRFKRYGESNDGGYLTCMDGLDSVVSALSVGVEQHDQWSLDTANDRKLPVSQFDCTVEASASCEGKCSFYRQCVVSEDGHEHSTLQPQVTMTEAVQLAAGGVQGLANRSLLLKIDCEGCEWPIFEKESAHIMRKFAQVIVEFHSIGRQDLHDQYAAAVKNFLRNGFKVVHLHGNNYGGLWHPTDDIVVPDVLEVTFVADVAELPECLSSQRYDPGLDHPNHASAPELPMASLGGSG